MQFTLVARSWDLDQFGVMRSGLRWLCVDGHMCRPGEIIAYCNIGFFPKGHVVGRQWPFHAELRDLQIAFLAPASGVLRQEKGLSAGGFFDQHEHSFRWDAEYPIGHLEVDAGMEPEGGRFQVGLLMLAGRRMTEIAEIRSGLLTGWHDRSRAWTLSESGRMGTLLSLGICEMDGVIRGEKSAFLEMFEGPEGPLQVVFVPDTPLVPNTRVLAGQLSRTTAEFEAISKSFTGVLSSHEPRVGAQDLIFAGALLRQLGSCPILDEYEILTNSGLRRTGPADAIVLSLSAELSLLLQHRRSGFACGLHSYRFEEVSPAFKEFMRSEFTLVLRSIKQIRDDYVKLLDLIRARRPDARVLIYNCMSSSGNDDVQCYAGFDAPLSKHVSTVRNKDLNLMLADLATEHDIAVIDADAIAAELGGRNHLNGLHQSGIMQSEIRKEIMSILRSRNSPIQGESATRR